MQYVDKSLVRPEWVTGLPRGEAFVRTRGENWKLRVPLLRPVGKKEIQEVAAKYGLAEVLTEFKEQARQVDGKGAKGIADSLNQAPQGQPAKDTKASPPKASAATAKDEGSARLASAMAGDAQDETPPAAGTASDDESETAREDEAATGVSAAESNETLVNG